MGGEEPKTIGLRKFEWQRLIFRLDASIEFKAVAWAYSLFADADGGNVRPGRDLIADGVERSERQTGEYTGELLALGLLTVTRRGGGRGGAGSTTVYRLSMPAVGALPMRLDPEMNRIAPRTPGRRPEKALDAWRAKQNERKPASGQSSAAAEIDGNPASGESGSASAIDENPASRQSEPDVGYDENPASGESMLRSAIDENPASGQSPVDNPIEENPGFPSIADLSEIDENPASHENDFHEKPEADWGEAEGPLRGSPASHYQQTKVTKRQGGLSPGGDPTDAPDETAHPNPDSSAAIRYAAAQALIQSLPPEKADAIIQTANAELRAEGQPRALRALVVRAAEIAARPEWDTA